MSNEERMPHEAAPFVQQVARDLFHKVLGLDGVGGLILFKPNDGLIEVHATVLKEETVIELLNVIENTGKKKVEVDMTTTTQKMKEIDALRLAIEDLNTVMLNVLKQAFESRRPVVLMLELEEQEEKAVPASLSHSAVDTDLFRQIQEIVSQASKTRIDLLCNPYKTGDMVDIMGCETAGFVMRKVDDNPFSTSYFVLVGEGIIVPIDSKYITNHDE